MNLAFFTLPVVLTIIAIVVGVIAIVLSVCLYSKIMNFLYDGELSKVIVKTVINSERIKLVYSTKDSSRIEMPVKAELSTEDFNFIVNTVINTVEEDMKQKLMLGVSPVQSESKKTIASEKSEKVEPVSNPKLVYKYASSFDLKKKTFFKVEDRPSDETIYELTINQESENMGVFSIYKYAYKRVMECRDFLEGACDVSGSNSGMNIHIEKEGILSFEGDKWIVVQPMKVKFI